MEQLGILLAALRSSTLLWSPRRPALYTSRHTLSLTWLFFSRDHSSKSPDWNSFHGPPRASFHSRGLKSPVLAAASSWECIRWGISFPEARYWTTVANSTLIHIRNGHLHHPPLFFVASTSHRAPAQQVLILKPRFLSDVCLGWSCPSPELDNLKMIFIPN